MSSVGFSAGPPNQELEKLREAWRSLNDLMRNLNSAEQSLKKRDLNILAAHLGVAKWNVEQVKKALAVVGQAKNQKASSKADLLTPHPNE